MSDPQQSASGSSPVLDEALHRLSQTGPEFRGGLSNHGPMVVEALVRLGRQDDVERWVDGYLPQLAERPTASSRISEADEREALGDYRRVGDWLAYFTEQVEEVPWREVLALWWPRLLPGVAAGATHGVIRTAQAVRALADDPHNPQRRSELAAGLAYWAARYVELPGAARSQGRRSMAQALAAMPSVQIPDRGLIVEQLAPVGAAPEFATSVAALQAPAETPAALNAAFEELTRTFADVYVTYGRGNPIGLVHAVTAPTAVHSILDHLPPTVWRASYDALWHVCAALYTAYARGKPRDDAPTGPGQDPDVSVANALASGDEHAIKLAEACLRQYRATSAEVYLHAASRGMYAAG